MKKHAPSIEIQWPFGRTVLLATLLLVVVVGGGESFLRIGKIRDVLPMPILGSGLPSFDVTYERWERLRRKTNRIDIVFMGSSMIKSAMQSPVFTDEIKDRTGQEMVAFNFSTYGHMLEDTPLLFQLIAEEINPRLIVVEVSSVMEYPQMMITPESGRIRRSAWGRYRMGRWNIRGWLSEHSLLYRYVLRLHLWACDPQQNKRYSYLGGIVREGGENLRDWRYSTRSDRRLRQRMKDKAGQGSPEGSLSIFWRSLENDLPVVLLEVPVREASLPLGDISASSVRVARKRLHLHAEELGIPLVDCADFVQPSKDHWANMNHLGVRGGSLYSTWAARKMISMFGPELDPDQ